MHESRIVQILLSAFCAHSEIAERLRTTGRVVAHLAYAADCRAGDVEYSLIEFRN
jgi:hypothetical protein